MKILIDATNIRSGGGIKHIINMYKSFEHFPNIQFYLYLSDKLNKLNLLQKNNCKLITPWWSNFPSLIRSLLHLFFFPMRLNKLRPNFIFYPGSIIPFTCIGYNSVCISQNVLPFCKFERSLSIKLLIQRYLYIFSYRKSLAVFFLTNKSKELIEQYSGNLGNSYVVPHAFEASKKISTDIYKKFDKNQILKILYISPILQYKNQINVLKALTLLSKDFKSKISLDFVGDGNGSYFNSFKLNLKKLQKKGFNIQYHGHVSHSQLIENLSKYDISIFASSCEALPFTIFELHENNLPLIISHISPMKDFFDDDIISFDPQSPKSICMALNKIFALDVYNYKLTDYSLSLMNTSWIKYLEQIFRHLNINIR